MFLCVFLLEESLFQKYLTEYDFKYHELNESLSDTIVMGQVTSVWPGVASHGGLAHPSSRAISRELGVVACFGTRITYYFKLLFVLLPIDEGGSRPYR